MARPRPMLNVTRLPARGGAEGVTLEVILLGPDPGAPKPDYAAQLTIDPDGRAIDVDVSALLRALTPFERPP